MASRGVRWVVEWVTDEQSRKKVERDGRRAAGHVGDSMEDEARKSERAWGKATDGIRSGFVRLAKLAGTVFAIRQAARYAREIFVIGSNAEETASKFRTVYGEGAEALDEWIRKWGVIAGLTKVEGQDMLATAGAIGQGFGLTGRDVADFSTRIVKLAGDMQSFHNVPIEETFAAIRSGITGEQEPLKRFGILLNALEVQQRALLETGKSNAKQLTQQELALARLNIIYERAGVAVGDLERTQDSQANKARRLGAIWENLKIQLAQVVVGTGAYNEAIDRGIELLQAFGEWVQDNASEISHWARITVQAGKTVTQTLWGVLKVAFEIGQTIGRVWDIWTSTLVASFLTAVEKIAPVLDFIQRGMDPLDWIPDVNFENAGDGAAAAWARVREQTDGLKNDVLTLKDIITDTVDAWRDLVREAGTDRSGDFTPGMGGAPGGGGPPPQTPPGQRGQTRVRPGIGLSTARGGGARFLAGEGAPGIGEERFDPFAALTDRADAEASFESFQAGTRLAELRKQFNEVVAEIRASSLSDEIAGIAETLEGAFEQAFTAIIDGAGSLPDAAKGIGKAVVGHLIEGWAEAETAKGVAMLAEGTWPPNPLALASAAKHFAAAGLFRALAAKVGGAGGGSGSRGGGGGGGAGGGGGLGYIGRGMDRGRAFDGMGVDGMEIVVVLDPMNPTDPAFQDVVYLGNQLATERMGQGARPNVRVTSVREFLNTRRS